MEGPRTPGPDDADAPLHVYTKVVLVAAGVALFANGLLLLLRQTRSSYFEYAAIDNLFLQFVCLVVAGGLGIHALLRARNPGETAYSVATRPRRKDVLLVLAALFTTALNVVLAVSVQTQAVQTLRYRGW